MSTSVLKRGPRKLILLSRRAVEENRARARAGETSNFVPIWMVFVYDPADDGSFAYYPVHSWKARSTYPVVAERPAWMPNVRPDDVREALEDVGAWVETTDELTIISTNATPAQE